MNYYSVEPEVAGRATVERRAESRPTLTYVFDGWRGDALLESYPHVVVTEQLATELDRARLDGYEFGPATTEASETFRRLYPDQTPPSCRWLRVDGEAGCDDVGTDADGILVVSEDALDRIERVGFDNYGSCTRYDPGGE